MSVKNKLLIILLVIVLLILGAVAHYLYTSSSQSTGQNQQSQNQPTGIANWLTYKNAQYSFQLQYPADFFDQNQQPKLLAGDCNYTVSPSKCPNINDIVIADQASGGGDINIIKSNLSNQGYWDNPDGTKQTIDNTQYCLYTTGNAAAGHAFNYYYFATVKDKKCLVVYLATSTTNCDNYLPLEKENTQQANNYHNCITTNQNQPRILDKIISTFKFTK